MFKEIKECALNEDFDGDTTIIVHDDVYKTRLESVARSLLSIDREQLKQTIKELASNYQEITSDEEFDKAYQLLSYNQKFRPAIVENLPQSISKDWSYQYKLQLVDKILLSDTPESFLLGYKFTPHVSAPILDECPEEPVLNLPLLKADTTSVFFNGILEQIQNELALAEESVKIAVSWFTNFALFKQIKEIAQKGVKVQLVINNDLINNGGYCLDFNQLIDEGIDLNLIEYPHLLHHKFCIIDDTTVLNGSYNWTRFSENNYENMMVFKNDADITDQFLNEFDLLLENAEHKHVERMPDTVPERPEYDRSAFKQYVTEELDAEARQTSDEREKITALHKASSLNRPYFEKINPEAKDDYSSQFKTLDDAADVKNQVVAMANTVHVSSQPSIQKTTTEERQETTMPISPSSVDVEASRMSTHKVDISESDKLQIIKSVEATSLFMVLDVSGSMSDTYAQGHVNAISQKALAATLAISQSKEVSLWTFGDDATFEGNIGIDNIADIRKVSCRHEGTDLNKFVIKASPDIPDGSLVVVFTDDDGYSINNAITGIKAKDKVFWQIIVYGKEYNSISSTIKDAMNVSVVCMSDYSSQRDEEINNILLKDYISWKQQHK